MKRKQWAGEVASHGIHLHASGDYVAGLDIRLIRPGSPDDGRWVQVNLTPDQARSIAASLIAAADQAEEMNEMK